MRPHELSAELRDYNFLYFRLALTVIGIALDVGDGRIRLASTPMLPYALALWAWCLVTLASRNPDLLLKNGVNVTVCVILYVLLSYPSQQLSTYLKMTMVILAGALRRRGRRRPGPASVSVCRHAHPWGGRPGLR